MDANRTTVLAIRQAVVHFSIAVCVLVPRVAIAQGLTGALIGTVQDDQGAVLPGASVRITSAALIGSGISPGYELIARDDRDPSRIVHAAATVDCARKNQAPRTYDLHKLGDRPSPPAVLLGSNSAGCSKAHA